ncbi:MAG: hypothetical protein J6Y02_12865 [Pseudobutyrivibrio sp.]|nr:hypothetical protein [Pseudobutyrivibrio sp.]
MLQITIPQTELFNEETQEFFQIKEQTLCLEHSLVSVAKWESKWKKPFLGIEEKTIDEITDYIRCMTITQNVNPICYLGLTRGNLLEVKNYIDDTMTATTFRNRNGPKSHEIITAEIIYYWMIELGIPFECQKWHLNRLLTLVNVCSIKNTPAKKMSRKDALAQQSQLNSARRAKFKSKG